MGSDIVKIFTFGLVDIEKKEKAAEKKSKKAAEAANRRANSAEESSAVEKLNRASGLAQPTGVLDNASTTGRGTILGN